MPKITSKIGLCLFSCLFVLIGCSDPNPKISVTDNDSEREVLMMNEEPENEEERIEDTYKKLLADKPDTYFEQWKYDVVANQIAVDVTSNDLAADALHHHKLWLGFDEHVGKENPKTFKFISTHPLSQMGDDDTYHIPLIVNDKPFSGVLIGIHKKTGNKILEAQFYEGKRLGTFNVWTNNNRLHTKTIAERIIITRPNAVRKPIVYLYPTQKTAVNISLDFNGELTHTYPKYNTEKGWSVTANTDGTLLDEKTGKTYPYLFWEGESDYKYHLQTGHVISSEATADFLDNTLAQLGLNRREATDFITYWLPELEQNPYNLIHFSTEQYQANAKMNITPTPDAIIRIFMVYQPLQAPIDIAVQQFDTKPNRTGFTVVEWGGKKASPTLNPLTL